MKKLAAMLLTLALVIGMVPVMGTVQAAGEVNTTLTYDGFGDQPNVGTGRWLVNAKLSTEMTATISGNPHVGNAAATASVNGEVKSFTMYVHAYSTSRIFYIMNYSQLGVSAPSALPAGTTVTIKAGTMTGYFVGQNDFTIYWTGSGWKEIREWDSSKDAFFAQRTDLLAVTNTDLQALCSSGGITGNLPLVGVGDACVYLNGEPTSKTTVNYHSSYGLYLDASGIKGSNYTEGDVLRVKGMFSQNVNGNMYYVIDESFVCTAIGATNPSNGLTVATWVYSSPLAIKQNTKNTLYLSTGKITANGSDYNVFGSTGASITYNGTAINRASNNYFLYSASNDALRVYLPEYGDGNGNKITDSKKGDIIHISGTFSCNGKPVNFGDNWFVLQDDDTWLHATEEPHICKGEKTDAVSASCTEAGNIAYWTCSCGKIYSDEACTQEITSEQTIVPASGHNLTYVEAKEATEEETGNYEYWYCYVCEKYFADEACNEEKTLDELTIAKLEHKCVGQKTAAKSATCTTDGNIAYWTCSCGKIYSDEACTQEITAAKTVIAKHTRTYKAKVDSTTTKTGTIAHYVCSCGKKYSDKAATKELTSSQLIIAKKKITVAKTSVKSLTAKKSALLVKWSKKSDVTGYEIQVCLKKDFKSGVKKATVKGAKNTSVTVKKLKSKKTYYVRVRAYKTVNGKKYTSAWSKVTKKKTK